jgi:hypothetical protein
MKSILVIVIGMIFVMFWQDSYSQEFNLEWEYDDFLHFIGDMDGDGIGEFVSQKEDSDTILFIDGRDHNVKWTVVGLYFLYYWYESDRNLYSVFPSIDYNGDGVREVLFSPYDYEIEGIIIYDVANNRKLFELTDPDADNLDLEYFGDVDGDGELEMVISYYTPHPQIWKTYVYSTGVRKTSIGEDVEYVSRIPHNHKLNQNFPNPFNPITTIGFQVQKSGDVELTIFNSLGQSIRTLVDESREPGEYSVQWDGKDDNGRLLASGVYFYQLKVGDFVSTKKMIMLK